MTAPHIRGLKFVSPSVMTTLGNGDFPPTNVVVIARKAGIKIAVFQVEHGPKNNVSVPVRKELNGCRMEQMGTTHVKAPHVIKPLHRIVPIVKVKGHGMLRHVRVIAHRDFLGIRVGVVRGVVTRRLSLMKCGTIAPTLTALLMKTVPGTMKNVGAIAVHMTIPLTITCSVKEEAVAEELIA